MSGTASHGAFGVTVGRSLAPVGAVKSRKVSVERWNDLRAEVGLRPVRERLAAHTASYNFVKIFGTPGCRQCSRAYDRQYQYPRVVERGLHVVRDAVITGRPEIRPQKRRFQLRKRGRRRFEVRPAPRKPAVGWVRVVPLSIPWSSNESVVVHPSASGVGSVSPDSIHHGTVGYYK
jgi:hypothetical protein